MLPCFYDYFYINQHFLCNFANYQLFKLVKKLSHALPSRLIQIMPNDKNHLSTFFYGWDFSLDERYTLEWVGTWLICCWDLDTFKLNYLNILSLFSDLFFPLGRHFKTPNQSINISLFLSKSWQDGSMEGMWWKLVLPTLDRLHQYSSVKEPLMTKLTKHLCQD